MAKEIDFDYCVGCEYSKYPGWASPCLECFKVIENESGIPINYEEKYPSKECSK